MLKSWTGKRLLSSAHKLSFNHVTETFSLASCWDISFFRVWVYGLIPISFFRVWVYGWFLYLFSVFDSDIFFPCLGLWFDSYIFFPCLIPIFDSYIWLLYLIPNYRILFFDSHIWFPYFWFIVGEKVENLSVDKKLGIINGKIFGIKDWKNGLVSPTTILLIKLNSPCLGLKI